MNDSICKGRDMVYANVLYQFFVCNAIPSCMPNFVFAKSMKTDFFPNQKSIVRTFICRLLYMLM